MAATSANNSDRSRQPAQHEQSHPDGAKRDREDLRPLLATGHVVVAQKPAPHADEHKSVGQHAGEEDRDESQADSPEPGRVDRDDEGDHHDEHNRGEHLRDHSSGARGQQPAVGHRRHAILRTPVAATSAVTC